MEKLIKNEENGEFNSDTFKQIQKKGFVSGNGGKVYIINEDGTSFIHMYAKNYNLIVLSLIHNFKDTMDKHFDIDKEDIDKANNIFSR